MTLDRGPVPRIIDLAERTARRYDLGALQLDKACELLLRVGNRDDIYGRVEVTSEDLVSLGDATAACFPDEPVLETAIRFGVLDIATQGRALARAQSWELAAQDAPLAELEEAAERACDRALERSTTSEVSCFAMLLTASRPERLLRQATELLPPTPEARLGGDEMQLRTSLISRLTYASHYEEAVDEARALPTEAHRAVAVEAIVRTHFVGQKSVELLPDVVVDLITTTDWSGAPDQLDITASYLVRSHRATALSLLKRWSTGLCAAVQDRGIYGASLIALVAGDEELALGIARKDAAAPRSAIRPEDGSRYNELADFVIGTLSTVIEERVEHLLRSLRPGSPAFHERRYVDAARLLLDAGELTPAACLFWLQSAGAAAGRRDWGPFESLDPALCPDIGPSFEEKLDLLKDLQAAGVPGTRRFDHIKFDNGAGPGCEGRPGGTAYLPRNLLALRAGCEAYEMRTPEKNPRSGHTR